MLLENIIKNKIISRYTQLTYMRRVGKWKHSYRVKVTFLRCTVLEFNRF